MICKNERENFPRLLESLSGVCDEFCICDTGSTDGTVEYLQDLVKSGEDIKKYGAPIKLGFFTWIDDFSAARNESFKLSTQDFIMWVDLDDVLVNRDDFIMWRDNAMSYADYWLAAYDYAQDEKGNSVCKFLRERVLRRSKNPVWEYFVHEGVKPMANSVVQYASGWYIKHARTEEDIKKDKSRNLKLIEDRKDNLVPRMQFYYGKELFENNKPLESFTELLKAIQTGKLEPHDMLLGHQYAAYAAMQLNQYDKARELALRGLAMMPYRAEYHVIIADTYLKENKLMEAMPFLGAAKYCVNISPTNGKSYTPIYNFPQFYTTYPRNTLAKCLFHRGDVDNAKKEVQECWDLYHSPDTKVMLEELEKIQTKCHISSPKKLTEDVVISCPQPQAYSWDEKIYREKGIGGSETAAVEMSEWIRKKTGRKVIVFNQRDSDFVSSSGVEYYSNAKLADYFNEHQPKVNIAWRHNQKITDAPTYLWCHDLVTQGVETVQNFDKILCLSNFHAKYVQAIQGVKKDKIIVTKNGIDPSRFKDQKEKIENKIIWPNSPDRGLERAIEIVNRSRKENPFLELHVFYGLDNLKKFGMADKAKQLEDLMAKHEWVKYHGNVEQRVLSDHLKESAVWLYPANFIETYCITAIEALSAKAYPLVREFGALEDTVRDPSLKGMATMLDLNCQSDAEFDFWANELNQIIREKRWNKIDINPEQFSWERVADEWIVMMGL